MHFNIILETTSINFGRLPEWNCPIPDTDLKSAEVHNDITTVQTITDIPIVKSSIKEVNKSIFFLFFWKMLLQ